MVSNWIKILRNTLEATTAASNKDFLPAIWTQVLATQTLIFWILVLDNHIPIWIRQLLIQNKHLLLIIWIKKAIQETTREHLHQPLLLSSSSNKTKFAIQLYHSTLLMKLLLKNNLLKKKLIQKISRQRINHRETQTSAFKKTMKTN